MINQIKKNKSHLVIRYLISALICLQILGTLVNRSSLLLAADTQSYADQLKKAEENYYEGEFEKAIYIIDQCLQDASLSKTNRIKAYTILTRIFLAKDDQKTAKENVQRILKLDPAYQPTIEQETPKFVTLVAEVREEQAQLAPIPAKKSKRKWIMIGAGSAAAAAIIVLVSTVGGKKNQQNNSLPEPPAFP